LEKRFREGASVESAPAGPESPDKDSEDGPGGTEREGEGKRQDANTEHLIHWGLLT